MPTIIDRYLLRQFLQVLAICFASLYGLYVVIDAFGHLDHFVDYGEKNGGLLPVLFGFYSYRMLWFLDRMSGILALVALLFTVTWIQRHNEMTALLAAGIPRSRVLRPVVIAAVLVSLTAAANRELVIPGIRHRLAIDSKSLDGKQEERVQSRFDSQTGILLGGDRIIVADERILDPSFMLPRTLDQFGKQIAAREATYVDADSSMIDARSPEASIRPTGYLLRGVTAPKSLLDQPSLTIGDTAVVITPRDTDWLAADELFVVSEVSIQFLSAGSSWRDFASTRELVHELHSPSTDLGADVRVAIHFRLLQPFLDTTLLFLGLPLVVSRTNRNPFFAIGLGLTIVTGFMIVVLGCQSLGTTGWLHPPLAAWLPLILFVPLAVGMSDSLRR